MLANRFFKLFVAVVSVLIVAFTVREAMVNTSAASHADQSFHTPPMSDYRPVDHSFHTPPMSDYQPVDHAFHTPPMSDYQPVDHSFHTPPMSNYQP
jgi:hypothetical protein